MTCGGDGSVPALFLQRVDVQCQEGQYQAGIVKKVARIDDTTGNTFKARASAQQAQKFTAAVIEEIRQCDAAGQIESTAQRHRAYQAHDGVVGAG